MSFPFNTPKTTGGFALGTSTITAGGGLTFGSLTTAPPATISTPNFSFGATSATPQATGFTSNLIQPAQNTATTGFSFTSPTPASTGTGFNVGDTGNTLGSTFPSLGAPASTPGFSIGAGVAKPVAATAPLTFGTPKTTAPAVTPSLPAAAAKPTILTTPTPGTGFSLGTTAVTTTASPAIGFSLGAPSATTSSGFALGAQSVTATSGFALGTTAAAPATTAPIVATSLPAPAASVAPIVPAATTTTTLPTSTAAVAAIKPATTTPSINFSQLEEYINKWTLDLEEQEKVFLNQVAQVNEWDRLLLANGDKIVALNSGVEKVKVEQQQLDHELDFIIAQQKELEECLVPLEKEIADITVTDPERDTTYRLAESLNTQLKQMSEDVKEIIEHINEKNKNQDSSDPIVQIGRILNAHMNSLQWIDQNTAAIQQQLDHASKLVEIHRRDNDSTQNL